MGQEIAVVLFNLGGPDKPGSIAPFLKNFFMDKAIINAPWPIRFLLSRYIAWSRGRVNGPAGKSYGMLGGKSPILEYTTAQAKALAVHLNAQQDGNSYTAHVSMRYWHPMSDAVAREVTERNPDRVILLPLYPQFSTTTTGSSYNDWQRAAMQAGMKVPTHLVCCYPTDPGFIASSVTKIHTVYDKMVATHQNLKPPRILFSAHGLPEKIITAGDPYQQHCEQTAAAIVTALGIANLDYQICYQSKVGRLKWIGPSTEAALHQAARDNVPVIVYPHAFVSDHVETLVEIEHEYRELATRIGIPAFARVDTVMTDTNFIDGLAGLVKTALHQDVSIAPGNKTCQCDPRWGRCPQPRIAT